MIFKKRLLVAIACLPGMLLSAQSKAPDNWFNLDPTADKVSGTGGDAAIQLLKSKSKKSQTVIVAVLDSGVEIDHEDLLVVIWTNRGVIPGIINSSGTGLDRRCCSAAQDHRDALHS